MLTGEAGTRGLGRRHLKSRGYTDPDTGSDQGPSSALHRLSPIRDQEGTRNPPSERTPHVTKAGSHNGERRLKTPHPKGRDKVNHSEGQRNPPPGATTRRPRDSSRRALPAPRAPPLPGPPYPGAPAQSPGQEAATSRGDHPARATRGRRAPHRGPAQGPRSPRRSGRGGARRVPAPETNGGAAPPPSRPWGTPSVSPTRSRRPKMHQPITSSADAAPAAAAIFASGRDSPGEEWKGRGEGSERRTRPRGP